MKNVRYFMKKKDIYVIAIIMFYESKGGNQYNCIGC